MTVRRLEVASRHAGTLRAYDTGEPGDDRLAVLWHHGTPNIGSPPAPLFALADELGVRWIGYDRPGYGGSTPRPGRDVASAAGDAAAVADALGVDRFALMGHSGGGPHALACAALLPGRVDAVAVGACLAPFDADGLDWFAGMAPNTDRPLRAAVQGRAEKERFEQAGGSQGDPGFTPADVAALTGDWSWLIDVVRPAIEKGPGGLIDDDLAYVAPWGFALGAITAPVRILHGDADAVVPVSHGKWLARSLPGAELWIRNGDGHISVLAAAPDALRWLADRSRAGQSPPN